MRIVFVGTPEFAAEILEHLIKNGFNVVGVVTQPDKPRGRGRKVEPTPVKAVAEKHEVPFIQPESINKKEALEFLQSVRPDVIIVASYGKILGEKVLSLPSLGCYNIHPSLLPKYRGASPIQRVLENGEERTGVTIYKMVKELDAGPIALQREISIDPFETFDQLEKRLIELSKEMLIEFLEKLKTGNIELKEQDHSRATYAPMIKKEDLIVDFSKDAESVKNKIRAYDSRPGARAFLGNDEVKLFGVTAIDSSGDEPGLINYIDREGAWIGTGDGKVKVRYIQFPGKKKMTFWEAKNGRLIIEGMRFERRYES
ncbi:MULTISPECIES: methionyl-tRNA formyltransferase [unclassified Thermotoga]|uniref:methionyl-tRNA formyltransferase n=1 Tax=unclassified Thermotoga TaxID=2631113 RepID=UPI000280EA0E|nr:MULTISPECIES: methionyl-tRNA formyltransferase [unclassified Thermotoga]AIY85957.1 methionyl-tRNA formyltransferase [Thermotoga sp. 2812B]EJX26758.1 methionyl-tRNA formyltransferase [Thermotoga sp. EMP]